MTEHLSEEDRSLLTLEREFANRPVASNNGTKEQAIREQFGWSAIAYYQRLNQLLDTEAAMAADPVTVMRLRRLREQRSMMRSRRRR